MRRADAHLNPLEIESLLFGMADSRSDGCTPGLKEAQHLETCKICEALAEKYRTAEKILLSLHRENSSWIGQDRDGALMRMIDCPDKDSWFHLAAGVMNKNESTRQLNHASACDRCGQLLKEAMEVMAQDITLEEEGALKELVSSPEQRRELGAMLAARARNSISSGKQLDADRPRVVFLQWPWLRWAGAGLAVIAFAVWLTIRQNAAAEANQLLAEAYTQQRTIELRIPGAKYGPIKQLRENGAPELAPSFYAAEVIIKRESAKHPNDVAWLQAQARASILQWKYQDAIKLLDAGVMRPGSNKAGLLLDKTVALSQLASYTHDRRDYDQAIELLGQVLKERPDDPIALFNRAILEEKLEAYPQAIVDWKHFLRAHPDDEWSPEARQHLEDLGKKLPQNGK